MPSFTTTCRKAVTCPVWNETVYLCGKYLLSEEKGHSYEGKFLYATCPIVQNLRLPACKRDEQYKYFPFCNHQPCELLDNFKPIIDVRYDHVQ